MTQAGSPVRVLFVCTGNSARSIMAEALLRRHGGAAFDVASAGTHPSEVNPRTIEVLEEAGIDASWARSTSVDAFMGQRFDYVITVCDDAREACPVFPGADRTLHWGYPDPATVGGSDDERLDAFRGVLGQLDARIQAFIPTAVRGSRTSTTR